MSITITHALLSSYVILWLQSRDNYVPSGYLRQQLSTLPEGRQTESPCQPKVILQQLCIVYKTEKRNCECH